MKPLFPVLLLLSLLPALPGQDAPLVSSGAVVPDVRLSREQLKELTGPIALYPDPLVAMILPASTFPSDVVLAARFVQSKENPALADEKPWDESIRGLTRYPDVLTWMDANLEWTSQLGYAYLAQPEDVMDAIQELRAQAQTVGNLVNTPQQRVVREETFIRIVPAEPEYIYVPYYEPEIVYYERPFAEPYLTFSAPWLVGSWLTFDFDWQRHRLYCGDWHGDWDYQYRRDRRGHRGENIFINNSFTNYQVWQGDTRRRLGSARIFTQNRDLLRQSTLATPSYFQERFDLNERERRAVAVSANVRQRDRGNVLGDVTQVDRDRDRSRFGTDGRIRTQAGERATLTKIADREKERLAVEAKKREEVRARLTAEGKISARDRDGKRIGDGRMREGERTTTPGTAADRERARIGADGKISERDRERIGADSKTGDRSTVGPDGRMTERTLPGEAPKPGEAPQIGERGRGKASKEGARERGRVTTPSTVPPTVTGEVRPDKRGPDDQGKGKGKDLDRGPSAQSVTPKAELPKGRPEVKAIPKSELPPGRPEVKDLPKADLPKGRPEVKEMPKVAPVPVIPNDKGKRSRGNEESRSDDKGKGKASQPGPQGEVPRIERPTTPRNDPTPRIAPQAKQEAPKARPQPPVKVEPPMAKVQTTTTVRPARPERKKNDEPTARKSAPSAQNVVRQAPAQRASAPKPSVAAVQRPQPQKQVAAAPRTQARPAVKPQVAAAPKPQQSAVGGKKPQDEEDKKKKEK